MPDKDITQPIPAVISARKMSASFVPSGARFDVSFADIPFIAAPDNSAPYSRESADFRKQQADTSKDAGEHSLSAATWSRSQTSFHHGAGINFYEPGSDDGTDFRFATSNGVDVWTIGQLTLLPSMSQKVSVASGDVQACSAVNSGSNYYFVNANGSMSRWTTGGVNTPMTGISTALGAPITAGSKVVVGSTTGLWSADVTGTVFTNLVSTTGVTITPYWVKNRIIAVKGNLLYEIPLSGGTLPVDPLYTHPDSTWVWTSVTETVDAILAAGYSSSGDSSIYRFSLQDGASGGVPIIGQAYQISTFPPGEQVYAIRAYLGKYIAIGTSLGLRIGAITGATSISPTVIQYGPLTVKTTNPVRCLAARDRFVYAGIQEAIDGATGVVRVDLEEEVVQGTLRFPYAFDVQTHGVGIPNSVCFLGNTDRVVLAVQGDGVYISSATNFEPSGYVTTGKVRYDTGENKAFRSIAIRAAYTDTSGVSVATIAPNGAVSEIIRMDASSVVTDDITITNPPGVWEYLSFKLTLDGGGSTTPTFGSYLVKALPVPPRERLIQYVLQCFDHERDSTNTKIGTEGYAAARILALEGLEGQAVVKVQDFTIGESFEGLIEKVQFMRNSPRGSTTSGFGGRLAVTVRKFG